MTQVGDNTIIGGTFTAVGGKTRGNVAAVDAAGVVTSFSPSTNGRVWAVAASEDGGTIFLGGTFTQVNGEPRANLAAVSAATGELLPSWQADTTGTTPDVKSLEVDGDRLYVAGRYGGIDGTTRKRLAAVSVSTGEVVTAFRPRADRTVNEIALSVDGDILYAGGGFTTLGGQPRQMAGAVFTATGDATSFAPTETGGNVVTVALSADGSRFFYSTDNNTLFAYDPAVSNNPAWQIKTSGNVQAIAASGTDLYIGGHFSQIVTDKVKRYYFASLNPNTGGLLEWDPLATGGAMGVWALLIDRTHNKLHAGGVFSAFNGIPQRGYARFSGAPAV
jgi:WD40 repeat protein